jgi:predicted nucleic acid-binding protein
VTGSHGPAESGTEGTEPSGHPARGLLDTNMVIHLPVLAAASLPDELAISAVTLAELSAGPHHCEDRAERARRISLLQHVETTFDPLPFDADAARAFGLVSAAVLGVGRSPRGRALDLMIAAVAVANGLPLYTIDAKDFAGLDGLVRVVAVARP